jgi:hypothetical protein
VARGVIGAKAAHQNDRDAGRVVLNFREPLGLDCAPRARRKSALRVPPPSAGHRARTVLEGDLGDDGEADQEDVGLRVRERAQAVIVLLAGRVPQAQVHGLAVDHHVGLGRAPASQRHGRGVRVWGAPSHRVVIEHGGDVLAGEGVRGVRDEQARLTDGTVSNNDALREAAAKRVSARERAIATAAMASRTRPRTNGQPPASPRITRRGAP